MKRRPYYFEQEDLLRLFGAAIDDIVIGRYNRDRTLDQDIEVSVKYASKQKVLHDIVNKDHKIVFPVIAFSRSSMRYEPERQTGKYIGFKHTAIIQDPITGEEVRIPKGSHFENPQPIEISVKLSIFAKFHSDLDQILSNITTFFQPYIVVSNKLPEEYQTADIHEMRYRIHWSGDVTFGDVTYDEKDKVRYTADTDFNIKGYLFKDQPEIGNIIYDIHHSYNSIDRCDIKRPQSEIDDYVENTETFSIYGDPKIHRVHHNRVTIDRDENGEWDNTEIKFDPEDSIVISGRMLDRIEGLFIETDNTALTGLEVLDYEIKSGILAGVAELKEGYTILNNKTIVLQIDPAILVGQTRFRIHTINPAGFSNTTPFITI